MKDFKKKKIVLIVLFTFFCIQMYLIYGYFLPEVLGAYSQLLPDKALSNLSIIIEKFVGFMLVWPIIFFLTVLIDMYKSKSVKESEQS